MKRLKPCPFCNNDAPILMTYIKGEGWRNQFYVLCDDDEGGCGAVSGYYHYSDEAVDKWNRRVGMCCDRNPCEADEHNGDECCVPYDTAVQREQDAFDSGFGKAIDRVLEIVEGEASDPDPEKDNEGCMYSEGWIECGLTIAEQIRALKGGDIE